MKPQKALLAAGLLLAAAEIVRADGFALKGIDPGSLVPAEETEQLAVIGCREGRGKSARAWGRGRKAPQGTRRMPARRPPRRDRAARAS